VSWHPGEVIEFLPDQPDLARVDVSGVRRVINVGLLADDMPEPGEWVLIHVGFALSKIDEDEAAAALEFLEPSTSANTPSPSLPTNPPRSRPVASEYTKGRKPTPCTIPWTRIAVRTRASMSPVSLNRGGVALELPTD
jgi:hydrogenase expression/formation protein HypC